MNRGSEPVLKGKLSARISAFQLFCLLYLSRVFLALSKTGAQGEQGFTLSSALLALAVDMLLGFAVMLPFLLYMRGRDGGLLENAHALHPAAGRIVGLLFAVPSFYYCAETVYQFGLYYREYIMENTGTLIVAFLMALAVSYAAFMGLEGVARMSFLVLAVSVVTFLLIGFGAAGNYDPIYLRALLFPVDGVWKQAMDTFGYFFDLLAFAVLYGNTKGGRGHSFVWSGVLGTATVAVLSVMVSAALGDGFISRVSFPVHTLAGISELSIFQRLDAGYLVCWTLLSFVRGALYGFCAYRCLYYAGGAKRAVPVFYLFAAVLTVLCSLFALVGNAALATSTLFQNGLILTVLLVGTPLVLFLLERGRRA